MVQVLLRGVTKRWGAFVGVRAIDLDIADREFIVFLGPSGCGKTTTLRMVAGLEEPTTGTVLLGGEDITRLRPYKRPVNTVFQNYALFPHLDVYENIAFGLRRRSITDVAPRVEQMLVLVELAGFERRKPAQLSGGQQQRVALARALINSPRVLLLDEPLGALDLKLRRQMQIELKRIQTEVGITFVHVTHDQEEAMTMADTVAVMNAGRIEQLGAPTEMYEFPATPFVANFLGQSNLLAGDVTGRAPLTHQGKYAARIVGAAIGARAAGRPADTAPWGEHSATADHGAVPQVVFTDPEVASVGRTEAQARDAGLDVRVVDAPIAVGGSALQADGYDGAARLVVENGRDVLVGATFVGQDVAEMLHAATIALVGEVPLGRLWHAVPAYPTISEVWLRLLEADRHR